MPLLSVIVALIVIGVLLYLVSLIPMDATIKKIITILVILVVVLWIINMFIPLGNLGGMKIGR